MNKNADTPKSRRTKRRHHRAGKGKNKRLKTSTTKIEFLNVRGIRSKIHVLNKHLEDTSPDILCFAETFLKSDDKPRDLHCNYQWIGKCRKSTEDKGGIGMCLKDDITIIDENLNGSMDDNYERMWILARVNGSKTAIGIAYFPNDGINKALTDNLMHELLENCSKFSSLGYEICLSGDFNGRCLKICEYTGKTLLYDVKQSDSYNGFRLLQFVDASELIVANSLTCCDGFHTRILNDQRSAIDYILMSKNLSDSVRSVTIDEGGNYDLHSDHVIISATLTGQKCQNKISSPMKNFFWKISDATDWETFRESLASVFSEEWVKSSNDINVLWDIWKSNVNDAADKTVKKAPKVKNYRSFWDKELDRLLKSRREANKLQRLHNKSNSPDSDLGKSISNLYQKRKELLQNAIKRKEFQNKTKLLGEKGSSNKNNSKAFWDLLKGPRQQKTVSQIIDPINNDKMVEDKNDIKYCLSSHFGSIGSDSTISSERQELYNNIILERQRCNDENTLSVVFTRDSISETLKSLKSGKASGVDEIPNEFLKYGGDIMIKSLTDLFTAIADIEVIPDDWHKGIIKPLHKSGSVYNLDNYRGITLTSNVYKLFSKAIESTIVEHLENKNILGENQGAFRKDRRIEDQLFALQGICSLSKSENKPLYVAFLDLSKAFDRVRRDGLLVNLWNHGIQGKSWRLIKEIYRNVQNNVLFGDIESNVFEQEYGVKQGCVLSPTLFSILMNDLVQMLNESNIGYEISTKLINCLLFADCFYVFMLLLT